MYIYKLYYGFRYLRFDKRRLAGSNVVVDDATN